PTSKCSRYSSWQVTDRRAEDRGNDEARMTNDERMTKHPWHTPALAPAHALNRSPRSPPALPTLQRFNDSTIQRFINPLPIVRSELKFHGGHILLKMLKR